MLGPGARLGRFRVVREVARSNDIVFEAYDETLGQRCAIKVLNIEGLPADVCQERADRFRREVSSARQVDHPNVVRVFDYCSEGGLEFYAMEFLDSPTLRALLRQSPQLAPSAAVSIARQVLDALACTHAQGIVHRDLKPENIHVSGGGEVKITDFGLAKSLGMDTLTRAGEIFGTPYYMAPEQWRGEAPDARTDLWAVGVILYEMLVGMRPFEGGDPPVIMHRVLTSDPQLPSSVAAGLARVLCRALAKDRASRYQSAADFRDDLRAAPTVHVPPPPRITGGLSPGRSTPQARATVAAPRQAYAPPPDRASRVPARGLRLPRSGLRVPLQLALAAFAIYFAIVGLRWAGRSFEGWQAQRRAEQAREEAARCHEYLVEVRREVASARRVQTVRDLADAEPSWGVYRPTCPVGDEPYQYDPSTGRVWCDHPGHEGAPDEASRCRAHLAAVRREVRHSWGTWMVHPPPPGHSGFPSPPPTCPVGGEEYRYDSSTGRVWCVHPGHERF